jgi:YbgC/YbaW family acyl-CoA thioester hydrolase
MTTKTLEREVESQVLIRFPDCDPFNHLNNAKYMDYIVNAREDHLLKFYDFDVHKIAKEMGITWVVAQTQIAYIIPVEVMEVVTIQTRLVSVHEKGLQIEAIMWNKDKTHLKAVMWSKLAHYNLKTRKSHLHSEELMLFFNSIHYPLADEMGFEERVKSLKKLIQNT